MMTNDQKNQIRKHANRNILYLLDKLGIQYSHRGTLIQSICKCPQHGGDADNDTAFSWRTDIGRWVCWTHHCEETYGSDIFALVRSIYNLSFQKSIQWVFDALEQKNIDIAEKIEDYLESQINTKPFEHEPLNEEALKFLSKDLFYLKNRGFDEEILLKYGVGLWSKLGTFMHDRIVFPVRDHRGFLVGYTGRTIHPESWFTDRGLKYRKWIHGRHYHLFPKESEFFTGSILFNLFKARRFLGESKEIILVEGPLDGMKLEMANIYNWVATLGTNFCFTHRTLLLEFGVNKLRVAYDHDLSEDIGEGAGDKGFEKLKRKAADLFDIRKVNLPSGKDPGSMSIEEIKMAFL